MQKLVQLIFGDVSNVAAVVLALGLAALAQHLAPQFSGWALVLGLLLGATWLAGR